MLSVPTPVGRRPRRSDVARGLGSIGIENQREHELVVSRKMPEPTWLWQTTCHGPDFSRQMRNA